MELRKSFEELTEERLKELQHLELAGITVSELDLGPVVILWTKSRGEAGTERWELLSEWTAELIVSDLHNDPNVERAILYRRLPDNAPMDVARSWMRLRMERSGMTSDSLVEAA